MDKLVSPFQNVFIQGRSIIDNILLAHEIFDSFRKKKGTKKGYGALKIDMCKAYDRVNWNFLKEVLLSMNFNNTQTNWAMECITTMQFTLLLNGSLTQPFYPLRGIRQGDLISPYLILLCANILSIAQTQVKSQKKLRGIKIGRNGVSFTHFFFANDSYFFFQNDKCSLSNLENTIQWYCSLSGQTIILVSLIFTAPQISP